MATYNFKNKQERNISGWPNLGVNFFGIPKNAHTAVMTHLYRQEHSRPDFDVGFDIHNQSKGHTKFITEEESVSNGCVNFAIVRDPISRFLSMYKDLCLTRKKRGKTAGVWGMSLDQFLDHLFKTPYHRLDIHFVRQVDFVPPYVDRIFKLESLFQDWNFEFPCVNESKNSIPFADISLTDPQIKRIQEFYREDLARFKF
mgnify:FL=1